jgi:hypothetical protein
MDFVHDTTSSALRRRLAQAMLDDESHRDSIRRDCAGFGIDSSKRQEGEDRRPATTNSGSSSPLDDTNRTPN